MSEADFEKIKRLEEITSDAVKTVLGLKTRRSAQRILRNLTKQGRLVVVGRKGRKKLYRVIR